MWHDAGTFLVVITGAGSAPGIYWVESRDPAKHPGVTGQSPKNKGLSGPTSVMLRLRDPAVDYESPWRQEWWPLGKNTFEGLNCHTIKGQLDSVNP